MRRKKSDKGLNAALIDKKGKVIKKFEIKDEY